MLNRVKCKKKTAQQQLQLKHLKNKPILGLWTEHSKTWLISLDYVMILNTTLVFLKTYSKLFLLFLGQWQTTHILQTCCIYPAYVLCDQRTVYNVNIFQSIIYIYIHVYIERERERALGIEAKLVFTKGCTRNFRPYTAFSQWKFAVILTQSTDHLPLNFAHFVLYYL